LAISITAVVVFIASVAACLEYVGGKSRHSMRYRWFFRILWPIAPVLSVAAVVGGLGLLIWETPSSVLIILYAVTWAAVTGLGFARFVKWSSHRVFDRHD
jgi:hypothetical protein